MFDVKLITDVSSELITTSEVKTHLNITYTDDDTYIGTLITKARKLIEGYCNISIGEQERQWIVDAQAYTEMSLPYGPGISVDQVDYKSDYATWDTLTVTDDYDVDGGGDLMFTPFTTGRFKVAYTAGYTTLPDGLMQGWLMQVAYMYENRGDEKMAGICEGAKDYLNLVKNYSWE